VRLGLGCAAAVLATALTGCITDDSRSRPFSERWSYHERPEKSAEKPESGPGAGKGLVLVGDPDKTRAAISSGGQGGPALNVGRRQGLSADVGYDRGPAAGVRYRRDWDFGRPKRPERHRNRRFPVRFMRDGKHLPQPV